MDAIKEARLAEIRKKLSREEVRELLRVISRVAARCLEAELPERVGEDASSRLERHRIDSGFTEEVALLVERLSSEAGMGPAEVLLKSLGLFKLAIDANAAGQRLAILDQDDFIVREIVGIDSPDPVLLSSMK